MKRVPVTTEARRVPRVFEGVPVGKHAAETDMVHTSSCTNTTGRIAPRARRRACCSIAGLKSSASGALRPAGSAAGSGRYRHPPRALHRKRRTGAETEGVPQALHNKSRHLPKDAGLLHETGGGRKLNSLSNRTIYRLFFYEVLRNTPKRYPENTGCY